MPSRLLENLDSNYIELLTSFSSKKKAKKVLVYVEGYEDKAFWYQMLQKFETDKLIFDIQLPSKLHLEKGKDAVLKFSDNTGAYLILCVDSDFDYLQPNRNENAKLITKNDYIFQTYSYSIENLQCYLPNLQMLFFQAVKVNNDKLEIERFFDIYCQIIYPIFVRFLYYQEKGRFDLLVFNDFHKLISFQYDIILKNKGQKELQNLEKEVKNQVEALDKRYPIAPTDWEKWETKLNALGVTQESVYLFIQGHTVLDKVVLPLLQPLCKLLKNNELKKISKAAKHKEERETEIHHYENTYRNIKEVITSNYDVSTCFLYQKIQQDIQNFMQTYH